MIALYVAGVWLATSIVTMTVWCVVMGRYNARTGRRS